jgi:hypothetical protein
VPLLGDTRRFLGREDFIAMKCFADGPQHDLDAKDAYLGAEQQVDPDLMRRITRRFGRVAADARQPFLLTDISIEREIDATTPGLDYLRP